MRRIHIEPTDADSPAPLSALFLAVWAFRKQSRNALLARAVSAGFSGRVASIVACLLFLASLQLAHGAAALTNGGFEDVGPNEMPSGWQNGKHSNGLADPNRQELETVDAVLRPRDDGAGSEIQYDAPPNSVSLLVIAR
jgi:hypothetical protein